ncbi:MAG: tail fiber domain-containing protein [Bacteroidota bacterium]
MKNISIPFFLALVICVTSQAQNVGIGISEPRNKLEVLGNMLVNTPLTITGTPPVAAQTYTMVNGTTMYTAFGDSTGRIYDPGGPAGNYVGNLNANLGIEDPGAAGVALEITFENIQLGTGDSLILRAHGPSGIIVLAIGNGYTTPGKWIFNSSDIYITFKSNADGNNGTGFSILYRRLFSNPGLSPEITGFAGQSLFFEAKTGALRSGYIGVGARGESSFAAGVNNTASGKASISLGQGNVSGGQGSVAMGYITKSTAFASTAMGLVTVASGEHATAMGGHTTASGNNATAMGHGTLASGYAATAMGNDAIASGGAATAGGYQSIASGDYSTAFGDHAYATGDQSTALGNHISSNNQEGSFLIGDNSTDVMMNAPATNNFRARFANGYRLYTSANYATGCSLGAGDNAWTTGSSVYTKENFAAVDGESFLQKIARFELTSWNYKTQDAKTFRHYGPMSQDFFAAFGKDAYGTIGNDTSINSADFAGVSFIAIQALEKRTAALQLESEKSKAKTGKLEAENAALKNELVILKAALQYQNEILAKRIQQLETLAVHQSSQAVVANQ